MVSTLSVVIFKHGEIIFVVVKISFKPPLQMVCSVSQNILRRLCKVYA